MKKTILLCLLSAVLIKAFSQNKEYTKSDDISNTRRVLLDKFIEKDRLGIILQMDRLRMLDDKDYLTLYPVEFWLLSYWLNEYNSILSSARQPDTVNTAQNRSLKIPPQRDYLTVKLIEKSIEEKDAIVQNIKAAGISSEEKKFLLMHIEYLLGDDSPQSVEQDTLNQLADEFLTRYPESEYAGFVRQFIRVKYRVSNNGLAVGLYSGKIFFSGNLIDYYKHPTLAGLSLDLIKERWLYQINLALAFCKTKKEMPVDNDVWPQGSKAIGGHVNLTAGRYVLDNKTFAVAPLAGIGVFGLDPNTNANKDPEYKGAGIKTNIAGNIGFIGDIKFNAKDMTSLNAYPLGARFTSVRIGYDFIIAPIKNNFINYSGTVHKITVGLAFSSRRVERVY